MATNWTNIFYNTLAKYLQPYVEASGDSALRAKILMDCAEEITQSPLHEEELIDLPHHLSRAIRWEFLPYLDEDDQKDEEANLVQLESSSQSLAAEEREAAARPCHASDYKTLWDAYRVAQRLFKDEVNLIDEGCRDKRSKSEMGAHTKAVRKWFNELPRSEVEEAERVAKKWNSEGCPDKERQAVYRKKNLRDEVAQLIGLLQHTMGVHCVVLMGYENADGGVTTAIMETIDPKCDREFTRSSNDCKEWAKQGTALLPKYMAVEDDNETEKNRPDDDDDDDVPEVAVDALGHPILPENKPVGLRLQQDVVREIFTKAYMRVKTSRRKRVRVPWLELAKAPAAYLDVSTIPADFRVLDPSKMTIGMIYALWSHWSRRANDGLPILAFLTGRTQHPTLSRKQNPETYVELESDGQASENEPGSHGNGRSGSPVKPSTSKHVRFSELAAPPHTESPAANSSNRTEYLHGLSSEPTYRTLLDIMATLPAHTFPQSSSSAPNSKSSLPTWVSWDWSEKYLPPDLHSRWNEFNAALSVLRKYEFADHNEGILIVLGFGLLSRECWRAVEVEVDDEDSPAFLRESLLTRKRANHIIEAIKDMIGRLPSPSGAGVDKEMQGEKDLDGSAEGRKAGTSRKRQRIGKSPADAPSPVRSSGRSSGTKKGNAGPTKNSRSQRQSKPSKKIRDMQ